ncbi:MAG TPA: DNA gyrase inhibitor YacG [Magnetospirillaceae bacterium]|jgi:hypothetical protein
MNDNAKHGCPICGKPLDSRYSPFCSARCKQVDLARWLGEVYVVPGDGGPANSDEPFDDDGKA